VLRVSDRDPELLQALEDAGIAVGVELTASPDGIRVDGTATALPDGAVDAIWVTA
jgi:DtxR family Mn-dependent transcriptional regulator